MRTGEPEAPRRCVRRIPPSVKIALGEYRRWQRAWYLAHYLIGVFAATAGAYTALGVAWGWSVCAAIGTALVTFLGPLQKAHSYKHAYYKLRIAVAKFESISELPEEWLMGEYEAAQQIVLTGDPAAAMAQPSLQPVAPSA